MAAPAGTFKWKSDEYLTRAGSGMSVPNWIDQAVEKFRTPADNGRVRVELPTGRASASSPAASVRKRDAGEPWRAAASPEAVECMTMSRTPVLRRRNQAGKDGWGWCMPARPQQHSAGALASSGERSLMPRTLSSPSTLTYEGQREAQRVLGANVEYMPSDTSMRRRSARDEAPLPHKSEVPQTCNQMYGSKAAQADRTSKFVPKVSCDVCLFTDAAVRTMTPYDHAIRF
eukprot:TRINITY_DN65361_c0_g1_i1.p1 TRINITY_DN65361_c0_g1~~TRINITY_DN65361_c0_g1_i1.p1  ORF type:complete len:270 (+),score=37.59 TRINITY_DN65361_c0_g1_i1:121-810(+)